MERIKLAGLRPQAYEHPLDTKALDALQNTAGLDTVVRKCNEWGFERLLRVQLTGNNLRVTADNFPLVNDMLQQSAAVLDVPKIPELYIAAGGEINAFTAGVEKPVIVLTTAAVDLLSDDELYFVIAHELGHVKSGHVLYYQLAQFLPVIGEIAGTILLGVSNFFTTAINTEDFEKQARDFQAMDDDKLSWIAKGLSVMGQTHPWTVMRAQEFLTWVDGGAYDRVLKADHASHPAPGKSFCSQCGHALVGTEMFCPGCGTRRLATALAS